MGSPPEHTLPVHGHHSSTGMPTSSFSMAFRRAHADVGVLLFLILCQQWCLSLPMNGTKANSTSSQILVQQLLELSLRHEWERPPRPSSCVWAIMSCCIPGSLRINERCFELLGCPGPFWDTNPCSQVVANVAITIVKEFYRDGNQK